MFSTNDEPPVDNVEGSRNPGKAPVPYLRDTFEQLATTWHDVLPFGPTGVLEDDLESIGDNRLMTLLTAVGTLKREFDGLLAAVAYEVETRSGVARGANAFARRQGFASTRDLLELTIGVTPGEARALGKVGLATTGDRMITGTRLTPDAQLVTSGIRSGTLSLAAATEIVKFRDRLAPRIDPDRIADGEAALVDIAPDLTLRNLKKAINQVETYVDPDGLEPRIDDQRRARTLTMRVEADGCLKLSGRLDPLTGAYVKTAIESYVTGTLQTSRGNNVANAQHFAATGNEVANDDNTLAADAAVENGAVNEPKLRAANVQFVETGAIPKPGQYDLEDRSIPQIQADALAAFCQHIMGCDLSTLTRGATTVVVRMPLQAIIGHPPTPSHTHDDDRKLSDEDPDNDKFRDEDNAGGSGQHTVSSLEELEQGARANSEPSRRASRIFTDRHAPTIEQAFTDAVGKTVSEIDGVGVIDAKTARIVASKAGIIPLVLGRESQPLDVGRRQRHFSHAQRFALVERDGGCASCGRPPGMTEAHHIRWWQHGGTTDINNGVLLCTTCHHRMHEGWAICIVPADPNPTSGKSTASGGTNLKSSNSGTEASADTSATVWFIPPFAVDSEQQPRLGGRKRFDPVYRAKHPPSHPPRPLGPADHYHRDRRAA